MKYGVSDFAGDLLDQHRQRQAQQQIDDAFATMETRLAAAQQRAQRYREMEASLRAICAAYQHALREVDPEHPFVQANYSWPDHIAQGEVIARECPSDQEMWARAKAFGLEDAKRRLQSREAGTVLTLPQLKAHLVKLTGQLESYKDAYGKQSKDLSDHRAERLAYRETLRQIDPENPLLMSPELRERMRRGAQLAFDYEDDPAKRWTSFDAAVRQFLKDEIPPPTFSRTTVALDQQQITYWKQQVGGLERDLCDHRAQRAVFRSELTRLVPDHPLIADQALRTSISQAGRLAFSMAPSGHRYEELDRAALQHFERAVPDVQARWPGPLSAQADEDVEVVSDPEGDPLAQASTVNVAADTSQTFVDSADAHDPHDFVLRQHQRDDLHEGGHPDDAAYGASNPVKRR